MDVQKRGSIYYGWIIVIAATIIFAVVGGQTVCFSVFIKPVAAEFHWSRTEVTTSYSLYFLFISLLGIAAGFLVNRYGPKIVIAAGSLVMGLGYLLASRTDSLWVFYITFGVLRGTGFIFIYIPLIVSISNWFSDKRGLALGIMFAGSGVGGLILSPLMQIWITRYSWQSAFTITGILLWCVTFPLLPFIKNEPEKTEIQPSDESGPDAKNVGNGYESNDHTVIEALKSSSFWIWCFAIIFIWFGILMAQVNLVPYATDRGIPVSTAAFALGLSAAFNAFGRLSIGAVSDKIGTKMALGSSLLLASVMMIWLIYVSESWMLYVFAIFFGLGFGGFMPHLPKVIAELFGRKSMGPIYGINNIFNSIGGAAGPILAASFYDKTGSYTLAFIMGGGAIFIGFVLVFMLKFPEVSP
jgi:MFS family permease